MFPAIAKIDAPKSAKSKNRESEMRERDMEWKCGVEAEGFAVEWPSGQTQDGSEVQMSSAAERTLAWTGRQNTR